MSEHEPAVIDDSEVLQEALDDDKPMNVKQGGALTGVVVGLVVSIGGTVVSHWLDGSANKEVILSNTATSVAELKTSVTDLSEQVRRLTEQPYVRREEFESRLSGLSGRVDNLERTNRRR